MVNRISSLHKSQIGRDQIWDPNSWVKSMFDDLPPRLKSERGVGAPSLDLNSQILPDYLTHAGLASASRRGARSQSQNIGTHDWIDSSLCGNPSVSSIMPHWVKDMWRRSEALEDRSEKKIWCTWIRYLREVESTSLWNIRWRSQCHHNFITRSKI
jgi:hypothetical protein